jgi:hypothetical protein
MKLQKHRQRGYVIPMILVGVILLGIFATTIAQVLVNTDRAVNWSGVDSDLGGVLNRINSSLSCSKTFTGSLSDPHHDCETPQYIDIRDKDNAVLIAQGGSTFGAWQLRARCYEDGLEIRVAKIIPASRSNSTNWDFNLAPDSAFGKHQMLRTPMNWSWDASPKQRHLVVKRGDLCSSNFTGSSSGGNVELQCNPKYFACTNAVGYKLATANLSFVVPSTCTTPNALLYKGFIARGLALCPSGWRPIGGGGKCDFTYGTTLGGGLGRGGGSVLSMSLNSDWTGYSTECCVYVALSQASTVTNGMAPSTAEGAAWAGCVPEI